MSFSGWTKNWVFQVNPIVSLHPLSGQDFTHLTSVVGDGGWGWGMISLDRNNEYHWNPPEPGLISQSYSFPVGN